MGIADGNENTLLLTETDRFPVIHAISTNSQTYSQTQQHPLYGPGQLLLQRLVILVWRQVDTVETSVTLRQLVRVARLLDREAPRAVRALQILEPVDGDTRRASGELQ